MGCRHSGLAVIHSGGVSITRVLSTDGPYVCVCVFISDTEEVRVCVLCGWVCVFLACVLCDVTSECVNIPDTLLPSEPRVYPYPDYCSTGVQNYVGYGHAFLTELTKFITDPTEVSGMVWMLYGPHKTQTRTSSVSEINTHTHT